MPSDESGWKSRVISFLQIGAGFLTAALAFPFILKWLMPSCYYTRIGCSGEPFFLILLIKALVGVMFIGTFYLALKYVPGMAGRDRI